MKKILACILISVVLLGLFAACGSNDDTQTSVTTNQSLSNNHNNGSQNSPENEENKENESNEEIKEPSWTIETLPESSAGLEFALNDDGKGYTVTGIGTCTETDIVIGKYNNLPVTSIRIDAFAYCTELTDVNLGDSITSIGAYAFLNCSEVTSVTIGSDVMSIGDGAFGNCNKLANITIQGNATNIGLQAFDNTAYYNNESNWDNGVLYIGKHLIKAKDTVSGPYTIKDGTKTIADAAFKSCEKLTNITLPDSITSSGYSAFSGCDKLMNVYITNIANWCNIDYKSYLSNPLCCSSNLYLNGKLVTDLVTPDEVTRIGDYAFYNYSALTSVTIGNSVTSIGDSAFDGCSGLKNITISNSVKSIGDYSFSDCTNLESINIPDSVISIDAGAFSSCTNLKSVRIPDNVDIGCLWISGTGIEGTKRIGAFEYCPNIKYNAYDNAYYIGNENNPYVFLVMVKDTSISSCNINSNTKSINEGAFMDCTELKSITISKSVNRVSASAFEGCTSLTSVTISDGVTRIATEAFKNCTKLASITIPDSITNIGGAAFSKTAYFNNESNWNNGVLYIGNHLIIANNTISGAYTIKEGTKTIANNAFYGRSELTSISIPNSVKSIGKGAFLGCKNLTSITIPEGVTSIEGYAFQSCDGLTSITIPASVTIIGKGVFYTCDKPILIDYKGTKEQWKAINKDLDWNDGTGGDYTITCTDGKMTKIDDN